MPEIGERILPWSEIAVIIITSSSAGHIITPANNGQLNFRGCRQIQPPFGIAWQYRFVDLGQKPKESLSHVLVFGSEVKS